MLLEKYDIILLDCDGVILNSNKIKSNCFIETLSEFKKKDVNKFIEYHKLNGGISRFKKIEYFLSKIINKKRYKTKYNLLLRKFSYLVKKKLIFCETDPYLINFLKKYRFKKIYIVSGSDENELKEVFAKRNLFNYFYKIYGSPKDKNIIIKNIMKFNSNKKFVLIGDSKLDYDVAKKNNIDFIFKYSWTEFKDWKIFFKNKKLHYCKNLNI